MDIIKIAEILEHIEKERGFKLSRLEPDERNAIRVDFGPTWTEYIHGPFHLDPDLKVLLKVVEQKRDPIDLGFYTRIDFILIDCEGDIISAPQMGIPLDDGRDLHTMVIRKD